MFNAVSARACSAALPGSVIPGGFLPAGCALTPRRRRCKQAVCIELAILSPAVNYALAAVLGGVWCLEPFLDIVHHDDGNLIPNVEAGA